MSIADREIMSREFGRTPFRIDAKGMSLRARPRLYCVTWELSEGTGVQKGESSGEAWDACQTMQVFGDVDAKALLLPGWALRPGCHLPTLTTSRPRSTPGRRPAGLRQCKRTKWLDGRPIVIGSLSV